jgi:hypothetical protein
MVTVGQRHALLPLPPCCAIRAHHAAIHPQGRAGNRCSQRATYERHQGSYFGGCRKALNKRAGANTAKEFAPDRCGNRALTLRQFRYEICYAFRCRGPGSTALTVTPVPAMVSARPREIASCAVLVMP